MKALARFWIFLAMAAACIGAEAPGFKVTKKYPFRATAVSTTSCSIVPQIGFMCRTAQK